MKKLIVLTAMISTLFVMPVFGQSKEVITVSDELECASDSNLTAQFEEAKNHVIECYYKYTTTVVNIRKEPSLDAEILGQSEVNTRFEVVAEINGWSMITTEDGYAFMKSDWFVDEPIEVAEKVNLGKFRITHYCGCKQCNGKWAGYPTHSGRYPEDGVTIAVDNSQIPFGTWVDIDGHAYRADDTGAAIKRNCIDIYVSSHEVALKKGVYYTDVYMMR